MKSQIDRALAFLGAVAGLFDSLPNQSPVGFDELWKIWPRKLDKGHARLAYMRARGKVGHGELIKAALAYVASREGEDKKYTPYLATWLNGERWSDELPPPKVPSDEVLRQQARLAARAADAQAPAVEVTAAERAEVAQLMGGLVKTLRGKVGG